MEVEDKISEMQKYIPCLKLLIESLEKNRDKEEQVKKMQYLLEMLTKKDSSIKLETLIRCEGILMKVYGKEQILLNNTENNGVRQGNALEIIDKNEKINISQEDCTQPTQEKLVNGNCSNKLPIIVNIGENQSAMEQDDDMTDSGLNGKDITKNAGVDGSNKNEKPTESQTNNDPAMQSSIKDSGNQSCITKPNSPSSTETLNETPKDSMADVVKIDGKAFNLVANLSENDSKQPENLEEDGECYMDIDEELTNSSLSKLMNINPAEVPPTHQIGDTNAKHDLTNMPSIPVSKQVEASSVEAKSNVVDLTSDDSNDESPATDGTSHAITSKHPAPFESSIGRASGNHQILSSKPLEKASVVYYSKGDTPRNQGPKQPVAPAMISAPQTASKKGNSNLDPLGGKQASKVATIVLDSDSDDDDGGSKNNASKETQGNLQDPNGTIVMPTPKLVKPMFTISSVQSMSTFQAQQEKRLEIEKELQALVKDCQASITPTVPKKYNSCVRVYLQNFIKELMFEKNRVNLCLQKLQKALVINKYKQVKKIIQTFCSEPVNDPSLPPPSPFCHRIKVYPEKLQFVMNQLFFINREISVIGYKVYGQNSNRPQLPSSSETKAPSPRKAQSPQPVLYSKCASNKINQSLKATSGQTLKPNLVCTPNTKNSPVTTKNITAPVQKLPVTGKILPVSSKILPVSSKILPVSVKNLPVCVKNLPLSVNNPTTAIKNPIANPENTPVSSSPTAQIQTVSVPTRNAQSKESLSLSPPCEDLLAPMKTQSVPMESPNNKSRRRKRRSEDDDDYDDDDDDENYVPQGYCSESDQSSSESTNDTAISRRKSLQRASKLRCQKYLELERALDDESFILANQIVKADKSKSSNGSSQPPAKKSKSTVSPKKEKPEIESVPEPTHSADEEMEHEIELPKGTPSKRSRANEEKDEDMDTNDDEDEEPSSDINFSADMKLRNVHRAIHYRSKYTGRCLICNEKLHRRSSIAHYVNSHSNREVFLSRITKNDFLKLQSETMSFAFLSAGKSAVSTYVAYCIFCQQEQCLSLKNWWEHYTRHTGEYVYGCTGCSARRSCRQQLTRHLKQECVQKGSALLELHEVDPNINRIDAYVCLLCNFIQLAEMGMIKHLKNEHEFPGSVKELPDGVYQTVNLLKIDQNVYEAEMQENEERFVESFEESNTDDVSFMICNMLASSQDPLQQNTELANENLSENCNENHSQSTEVVVPESIPAYHLANVAGEGSKGEVEEKKVEVKIEKVDNQDNIMFDNCALKIREYMTTVHGSVKEHPLSGVLCKNEKIEEINENFYIQKEVDMKTVLNDVNDASKSEKRFNDNTSARLDSSTTTGRPVAIVEKIKNESNISSNIVASDDVLLDSSKAPVNIFKCESNTVEMKNSAEATTDKTSNTSSLEEKLTIFATEKILQQVSISLINNAYNSIDVSMEASSGLPETTTISSESTSEMPESVADSVESGPEFLNPSDVALLESNSVAEAEARISALQSVEDCKDVEEEKNIVEKNERYQIKNVQCTVDEQVESILPDVETNKIADSRDDMMKVTDKATIKSKNDCEEKILSTTSAIVVEDPAGEVFEIVELPTETAETNDCVLSSIPILDLIVPDSVIDEVLAVENMDSDLVAVGKSLVDPMEPDFLAVDPMETDAVVNDLQLNDAMDANPTVASTLRADVEVAEVLNASFVGDVIEPDLTVNPVITHTLPVDLPLADAKMEDLESSETMLPKTNVESPTLNTALIENMLVSDTEKADNEVLNADETS